MLPASIFTLAPPVVGPVPAGRGASLPTDRLQEPTTSQAHLSQGDRRDHSKATKDPKYVWLRQRHRMLAARNGVTKPRTRPRFLNPRPNPFTKARNAYME